MSLSNEFCCGAGSFSCCHLNPHWCFQSEVEALFPCAGVLCCAVCFSPPPFLPVYRCANVGPQDLPATTLWGLLAAAWPAPFHNPPPCWVFQLPPCLKSSPPRLPVSAPPTGLDECFFFISMVVGLPYSSIFWQFWLFFVFKLLLSFFWLCEEAQCVYLCLYLGRKPLFILSFMSLVLGDILVKILLCGISEISLPMSPLGLLWCCNLYLSILSVLSLLSYIV